MSLLVVLVFWVYMLISQKFTTKKVFFTSLASIVLHPLAMLIIGMSTGAMAGVMLSWMVVTFISLIIWVVKSITKKSA